jgi:uncharacterized membrane protein
LLFFIHHISHAISVSHIVDRIASETEAVIEEIMPWPRGNGRPNPDPVGFAWDKSILSEISGYIRFVDKSRLVSLAKAHRVKLQLARRVGLFVPAGTPLLLVQKGDRITPEIMEELRRAIDIGPSRTLQQDIDFGILQIVDIALKAISPAVNDPSTAISSVDQLSRILIRYVSKEPPAGLLYDPPGVVRVQIPWSSFDQLLTTAFEQIRMYSKSDVAVSLRLLRALGDIAGTTAQPSIRASLGAMGKRIVEGCSEKLTAEELEPVRVRLAALEELTGVAH